MKLLKTCPILIGIVVITIALSVVSFVYEDSIYADYKSDYDQAKLPHFILVFKGATDGIYPWNDAATMNRELADGEETDALVTLPWKILI